MQINSINNYSLTSKSFANKTALSESSKANTVSFAGSDEINRNKALKAMRNAGLAMMLIVPTASSLSSCEKEVFARAEAEAWGTPGYIIEDSVKHNHPTDTIVKWWTNYERPIPLDTLFKNMDNWDIPGTDGGNMDDGKTKRNIIHYEGTREWEYNTREVGDMNLLESSKNILVYDTEITDYKGNHENYGKRVLRIPSGNFTIRKEDGTVLRNPAGLFVEEYENEFDEKKGSILDCKLKSRAFVTTLGDTMNVAKRKGSTEFVEGGKVSRGYLGANSILLKNLIGEYSTDDHYVDFKVEAVEDDKLRDMYVDEMDKKEK